MVERTTKEMIAAFFCKIVLLSALLGTLCCVNSFSARPFLGIARRGAVSSSYLSSEQLSLGGVGGRTREEIDNELNKGKKLEGGETIDFGGVTGGVSGRQRNLRMRACPRFPPSTP